MKRYLAVLTALVILLTPVVNTTGVFAVVYSGSEYGDIISTLVGAAETYEENFNNVQDMQGTYTQLYQARQIFSYAVNVYAAAYSARNDKNYRKQVGSTLGNLALNLSDMIVEYNSAYFVTKGEYEGVEFAQRGSTKIDLTNLEAASDVDIVEECSALESWCIKIARQYVVKTLEVYAGNANKADEDEKASLCAEIYRGLEYGLTCISDAESVMGLKNGKSLTMAEFAFKNSTVETRLKDDIEKYADVYTLGQADAAIDGSTGEIISIDPSKSILENMADVYVDDDETSENYGTISIEEEPELALAYLAIVASSSVYTPFESYVGDSRFMNALDSLCEDQETVALLDSYYNSLKLYKKPLYYRELNSIGNPEGQAELKSASEIFELISEGAAGALCTVSGELCINTNTGDWVYTPEKLDSSLTYELKTSLETVEEGTQSLGDAEENTADVNASDAARAIYKALSVKGMSDIAICGVLGNIHQECGMNCAAENSAGYKGLCQWGSGFTEIYNNWSDYKNNLNKQIEYLVYTLYDSAGGYTRVEKSLASATSVQDACDIFCKDYERCITTDPGAGDLKIGGSYYQDVEARRAYAEGYYEKLDELKGTTTASVKDTLGGLADDLFGVQTVYATEIGDLTDATEEVEGDEDTTSFEEDGTESVTNEQTLDSSTTVITEYTDKAKDFTDSISAATVISDESRLNGPALLFGSVAQRDIDNMTTAIYSNVLQSVGDYNIGDADEEYLYLNAFGDIVTADDLVVFPGILNPLLYADGVAYNPYTVAFMNSYPVNVKNSAYYTLSSKSDVGKYCAFLDTTEGNEASAIRGYNSEEEYELLDGDYEFALLNSVTGVKTTQTLKSREIYNKFIYGEMEQTATFRLQKYLFCHNVNRQSDLSTYVPLIESVGIYADGDRVFPYDYTQDNDGDIAKVIASNMYQYLTTDLTTKEVGNLKKLNDNWILHYVLISGSEGTADISSYKNNLEVSYDGYTESGISRAIKQITEFSEKLINSISGVTCVLGLQNSYEDPLLGKIVTVIRDYWLLFYIAFLFVVLIAIMKARKDLLQSAFLVVTCSVAAYAFVYLVPVYLPMFYNLAVNNLSDRVAYEVLVQNCEYNEGTADNIVDVDEDGKLKYNTSSITLYRMPSSQLETYYESLGIALTDATGGESFVIDQYSGFFVEGDSLKMSTDVLFGTLKIVDDDSTGELHAYKTVSNNVDYYIPYYQIVDSIVDKLNKCTSVYDVNHTTTKLRNGSRANNFRTYTYFNSPIFTDPENLEEALTIDVTGWTDEEITEYADKQQKIIDALRNEFGDNEDWLGLYDLFVVDTLKTGSNLQDTLWFQTMCDVGYYYDRGNGWEADEDNINALITYVNYQTKNFVYEMREYVGDVSDEAMIEVVALRAVIAFTQEASDFTHWMYPFSVNYPEFSLGDVEVSTFVEKYSDYAKNDYSIAKYVADKYGWFNLIVFDLMSILLFAVTWVVRVLSAIFYVLLLLVLLIRMFGDGQYATVVKGFLKCSGVIAVTMLLQVVGISIGGKLVGNVVGIYAVLALSVLTVYLLVIVITSLIFNFTEFGNTALNARVTGITNSIKNLKNVSVTTMKLQRETRGHNPAIVLPDNKLSKYDFDVDTDEQYDLQIAEMRENEEADVDGGLEFYEDDESVENKEYEF